MVNDIKINKVTVHEGDTEQSLLVLTNCLFKQEFNHIDEAMYFLLEKAIERKKEKERKQNEKINN